MKIYGSTEYVDLSLQKDNWYQLSVTNQWEWGIKSICSKRLKDGYNIFYHLKYNTPISEDRYQSVTVLDITEEIKEELLKMEYNIL